MLAPIAARQLAKSTTSGSLAAFSITVTPSAKLAAMMTFSVPVTLTGSKIIFAPFSLPFTFALIFPSSMSISAPIALIASMCKLTGRLPIAHPPGKATVACPNFASNGPKTKIEALMVFTNS